MLSEHDNLVVTLDPNHKGNVTLPYNGRRYGLIPGKGVVVPFELVRLHFGDPRSTTSALTAVSEDGREKIQIRSRAEELRRLETLWGVSAETLRRSMEAKHSGRPTRPATLDDVVPPIMVETVDGDPVTTVISDPSGTEPATVSVAADDAQANSARIEKMQRDLDELMARQRALDAQEGQGPGEEGVKEDGPGA